MLNPHDRQVYLDALKPPQGFTLHHAIGTTFSLDLETLLSIPLGFAVLDWENSEGKLDLNPVKLLHALRHLSTNITIFCQVGRIAVPHKHHPLFSHLEPMVIEVNAPSENGIFHPKTWLLRFTSQDNRVIYRFVCLSRNLTQDRSWDTILTLDGELTDRERAFSDNHPLGDFIAALPKLAQHPLNKERKDVVQLMATEVRRVKFELPDGIETLLFWPMGLQGSKHSALTGRIDRLLIVSPFVSPDFLSTQASLAPTILISRSDSLDAVPTATLKSMKALYALDDNAIEEDTDDTQVDDPETLEDSDVHGLHAKVFIADQGRDASVWMGSANATDAAFNHNVEFLVQMTGPKNKFGIDAFMGAEDSSDGFRNMLVPHSIGEPLVPDPETRSNEKLAEAFRRILARAALSLRIEKLDTTDTYNLNLIQSANLHLDFSGIKVRCWPAAVNSTFARDLRELNKDKPLSFINLTMLALTSFVVFEVTAGEGPKCVRVRFALNLPLSGAPDDRLEQVLNAVLGSKEHLLHYLMFLLARDRDTTDVGIGLLLEGSDPQGGDGKSITNNTLPLLEELVRTLSRNPEKLDAVAQLINDLKKTPEGLALMPERFEEIWTPIWTARLAQKEQSP